MAAAPEPEFSFRPLRDQDVPELYEKVERASFTAPWPEKAFYDEIHHNQFAHYTVLELNGEIAGYCGLWLILDEAHITNIAIRPKYRGMGLGKAMLVYVMELAKLAGSTKMTLEVRVSNEVAQNMYKQLGFEVKGVRPRYYSDNQEDAYIMWVNLDGKENGLFGTWN